MTSSSFGAPFVLCCGLPLLRGPGARLKVAALTVTALRTARVAVRVKGGLLSVLETGCARRVLCFLEASRRAA
ncbi:hypothetical protein V5799_030437 [Amblyomma americanum]|uniref:Uncharacterized protein n=1 Tax=Amblyomma americanum TaxID=6943 RepID=A0AAQ4EN60_AMBAM